MRSGTAGVETACKGSFRLLFYLLRMAEEPRMQQLALEVRACACSCVRVCLGCHVGK